MEAQVIISLNEYNQLKGMEKSFNNKLKEMEEIYKSPTAEKYMIEVNALGEITRYEGRPDVMRKEIIDGFNKTKQYSRELEELLRISKSREGFFWKYFGKYEDRSLCSKCVHYKQSECSDWQLKPMPDKCSDFTHKY